MPSFPKPSFDHDIDVAAEKKALRGYRDGKPGRTVPSRDAGTLMLASWNIANLGAQSRDPSHYELIAEIIQWFDLVALQEVRDDLAGLRGIMDHLSGAWRAVFTDMAGNDERMAYLYRYPKVKMLEFCGELAIPVSAQRYIKLPGVAEPFRGFDRNPMITAFDVSGFRISLANVHLYFGKQDTAAERTVSMARRQLEAFAVSRWCDLRRKDKDRYTDHIAALGDFNLPKWDDSNDPIRKALSRRGLKRPPHATRISSAIASDSDYDQIMCVPGLTSRMPRSSVFDYDGGIFADLYETRTQKQFNAYLRYYMSDHRPIWAEIEIT